MEFTLAIIGRPNVGKSTLFNRLTGKKMALVDDTPGVTRDRREGDARLGDLRFTVIDTAGLETAKSGSLEARMKEQTQAAMAQADMILMLTDARAGILPEDRVFAELVRKSSQKVILAANKYEGQAGEAGHLEAYELGLGDPIGLSAEHGHGMGDIYDRVRTAMAEISASGVAEPIDEHDDSEEEDDFNPDAPFYMDYDKPLRVAILGRPNAGKSTLVNYLLGEERMLTGPEAGITRDSIGVKCHWMQKIDNNCVKRVIKIWDTAGIRRKAKVTEKLEKLSVADGLRAVKFAEVVVLLIDATSPFDKQDIQLADLVEREGRALVIAINKWDMKIDRKKVREIVKDKLEFALPRLKGVPVITLSALTGKGIEAIFPIIARQQEIWNARIPTAKLNIWLSDATDKHNPPADKGRPVKLRYITQAKSRPPTFVTFSSRGHAVPDSYIRYLTNSLREHFGLSGIPIRFFVRKHKNPYVNKK